VCFTVVSRSTLTLSKTLLVEKAEERQRIQKKIGLPVKNSQEDQNFDELMVVVAKGAFNLWKKQNSKEYLPEYENEIFRNFYENLITIENNN